MDTDTGLELFQEVEATCVYELVFTEAPEDFIPKEFRGPITTTLTMKATTVLLE